MTTHGNGEVLEQNLIESPHDLNVEIFRLATERRNINTAAKAREQSMAPLQIYDVAPTKLYKSDDPPADYVGVHSRRQETSSQPDNFDALRSSSLTDEALVEVSPENVSPPIYEPLATRKISKKTRFGSIGIISLALLTSGAALHDKQPSEAILTAQQEAGDPAAIVPLIDPAPTPEVVTPTPVPEAVPPTPDPNLPAAPAVDPNIVVVPPTPEAPPLPPPQVPFTVCSYNVHYGNDEAIQEIMALLTQCDLLGVQELTRNKEALLAQAQLQPAGEFDAHVPLEPNTETATFSRKARFTFEGAETIKLHDQPLLDAHFPKQKDPNNIEVDNATRGDNDESDIRQKTMSIMKTVDNTNSRKYAFASLHTIYGFQNKGVLETEEKDRLKIYTYEVERILGKIAELEAQGYQVVPVGDTNWNNSDPNPTVLDNILLAQGYMLSDQPSVPNRNPDERFSHNKTSRIIDKVAAKIAHFTMINKWIFDDTKENPNALVDDWNSDHDPVGVELQPVP